MCETMTQRRFVRWLVSALLGATLVGVTPGCNLITDFDRGPASCSDGIQNQRETDVDCGGPHCSPCGFALTCAADGDCEGGVCTNLQCGCPLNHRASPGGACACPPGTLSTNADGSCVLVASCKDYLFLHPDAPSGNYWINTGTGGDVEVYCDMEADRGAGYTLLRLENPLGLRSNQADYVDACAAYGMEVVVPRTRAHARSIEAVNGELPNLVNVLPKASGTLTGLYEWTGICEGSPCSFWLSNDNSADCQTGGNQPPGATPGNRLYRIGTECDFGRWQDGIAGVIDQGWVLCSPNDAGPAAAPDCLTHLDHDSVSNAGPDGISGVYAVSRGIPYEAHCDMESYGGGWTLTMKADGANAAAAPDNWGYDSARWTDSSRLNETEPDIHGGGENKLQSFHDQPFTQLLVGIDDDADISLRFDGTRIPIDASGANLRAVFMADTPIDSNVTRVTWSRPFPALDDIAPVCNAEGLNQAVGTIKARVGIVGNNCAGGVDDRAGIGLDAGCVEVGRCGAAARFGALWVRDVPIGRSCADLQTQGVKRSGVYVIDPDGDGGEDPFQAYCDMETLGGGWTLLTINGTVAYLVVGTSVARPHPYNVLRSSYPRPGASIYGSYGLLESTSNGLPAIRAGVGPAFSFSIDAKELFKISKRELYAFVGGTTKDYITTVLPLGCNFFDAKAICYENTFRPFTVYRSDGSVLTSDAQACTSNFLSDAYNEFGLHLLDGIDDSVSHCAANTTSMIGFQNWGRIYTTFNRSTAATYWNGGVHSHWNEAGVANQPGFLMLR